MSEEKLEILNAAWEQLGNPHPNEIPKMLNEGMFSSDTGEWFTPPHIIEAVKRSFGGRIEFDPCSCEEANEYVGAESYYTEKDDGLNSFWDKGSTYLNPPYGREISKWVDAAVCNYRYFGVKEIILLVPARTDTQWWKLIGGYPVCFLEGRLKFVKPKAVQAQEQAETEAYFAKHGKKMKKRPDTAPFPSALVYLGPNIIEFILATEKLGTLYLTPPFGTR